MQLKKSLVMLLGFLPLALMAQTPPPGYDQLQDIWIVKSSPPGEWAGGDLATTSSSSVPLDTTQMYNGLPSLSYDIAGSSQGWWTSLFWGSDGHPYVDYSLEYYEPGFLEFDVKGAVGGERFNLSLSDEEPTRNPVNLSSKSVNIGNYVTVSTSWQHVRIPLADFGLPAGFKLRQVHQLQISESYDSPTYVRHFWINGIKFTSPSKEHTFPAVKVDQIGYEPIGTKYALVTGFGELLSATAGTPFHVIRTSDGTSVYDGTLKLETPYDSLSGDEVFSADFSAVTTPGTYFIRVDAPGVEDSLQFQIGFGIFNKVLRDSMRYYYFQRQGIAIEEPYGEGFTRPLGTPSETAAYFQSGGPNGPRIDVSHGWYDAGDQGKYVANSPAVVVDLMDAYSTFPWIFYDGQNNIPESGNGKPDILDEVKWELDWLVKMQDPASGGFYAIASAGSCLPNVNPCRPDSATGSYILDVVNGQSNVRPTPETANAVAALAHAARVYETYDPALAASYLAAAQSGWGYLTANPQVIPSTGLTYGSSDDSDGRLWAAAELFRTTGDAVYSSYFLGHYQKYGPNFDQPNGTEFDVPFRAFIAYNLARGADCQERAWFQQHWALWRAGQLARMSSPWRNFLYAYWWGSNSVDLGAVSTLVMGDRAAGYASDPEVMDAARNQMNYILGVNPLRHSYVVGEGADSATTTFSGLYWAYGVYTPPAGYMGGGPNWYSSPWFSRFQARAYADSDVDYQINENDIGYNLPLVFTAAVVATGKLNTLRPKVVDLKCDGDGDKCHARITITNTGLGPIRGPFRVLLTSLTSGVTVLDASGQIGGSYYRSTEEESLERGESMSVHVEFGNPSKQAISFTPVVEVLAANSPDAARCGDD